MNLVDKMINSEDLVNEIKQRIQVHKNRYKEMLIEAENLNHFIRGLQDSLERIEEKVECNKPREFPAEPQPLPPREESPF